MSTRSHSVVRVAGPGWVHPRVHAAEQRRPRSDPPATVVGSWGEWSGSAKPCVVWLCGSPRRDSTAISPCSRLDRGRERNRLVRFLSGSRFGAMRRSLVAVHTLLAVDDAVVCLAAPEPAPEAEEAVAGCSNDGTFPCAHRRRNPPRRDAVLSPIILYDFPRRGTRESAGQFCDSTEIDELSWHSGS